jgi:hypothetical protein
MIEINEGVSLPEALAQLLARNHLAGTLEEHDEDLKGLLPQLQPYSLSAQFTGAEVGFKDTKTNQAR